MQRNLIDLQVGAGAVAVAIAGLSLGGPLALAGLGLAATGSAIYFSWLRPSRESGARGESSMSSRDVLWSDAENALRILDRYPGDGELNDSVTELARIGRRAVERGRQSPADPSASRTRHVLCLAAETLATYMSTSLSRRHDRRERMQALLEEATRTLARQADTKTDGDALCIHLRVLEQELKSTQDKGQDHEPDDTK